MVKPTKKVKTTKNPLILTGLPDLPDVTLVKIGNDLLIYQLVNLSETSKRLNNIFKEPIELFYHIVLFNDIIDVVNELLPSMLQNRALIVPLNKIPSISTKISLLNINEILKKYELNYKSNLHLHHNIESDSEYESESESESEFYVPRSTDERDLINKLEMGINVLDFQSQDEFKFNYPIDPIVLGDKLKNILNELKHKFNMFLKEDEHKNKKNGGCSKKYKKKNKTKKKKKRTNKSKKKRGKKKNK